MASCGVVLAANGFRCADVKGFEGLNSGRNVMKFTYDVDQGKIFSSDTDVWVDDLGINREGPREFVFHYKGKKIGLVKPSRPENNIKAVAPVKSSVTIERIGVAINRTVRGGVQHFCEAYSFEDLAEQEELVGLIVSALLVYSPMPTPDTAVYFTKSLEMDLSSGALILGK